MVSFRAYGTVVLAGLLGASCGGSGFSGGLAGGSGDGSVDASGNGGDATATSGPDGGDANDGGPSGPDAGNANDGSLPAQDASDANDSSPSAQDGSDAMLEASGAPCPDVRGAYSIAVVEGQGCGTLNASAPQCIRQGQQVACGISFQSAIDAGLPAINGGASLQSDGSFANAALTEGALARTGCTGTRNAATSTITVDCGGTGSSQSCVVALQRIGNSCN